MKTILLTGATGFLGSHLLKTILHEDYTVIVLKRSFSNTTRINNELKNKKLSFYNIDKINLEKVFKENKIDVIIHCATEYGRNNVSCFDILKTNLMFPIELLELAEKYKITGFINTDSYFNKKNLSYPYLLNYSLSKKSLKLWLEKFSKNFIVVNLMLEHLYGENDNSQKFVEQMINKIAIQKVDSIDLSEGNQKRDFIYVEDVCDIYLKVLNYIFEQSATYIHTYIHTYENINVGTGHSISIREFVETIKKLSNSNTKLNFGIVPTRQDEIMDSFASENKFSLKNYTNIEEGIRKMLKCVNKGVL